MLPLLALTFFPRSAIAIKEEPLYPALQAAVSKALSTFKTSERSSDSEEDSCKTCVTGASMSIVEHIKWAADKVCKESEECESCKESEGCEGCDRKRRFCRWWKRDPEEALGFLIVKVRPLQDAYFYCLGKQQCKHPTSGSAEHLFSQNTDFAALSFVDPSGPTCDALEHATGIQSLLAARHGDLGPEKESFLGRLRRRFFGQKKRQEGAFMDTTAITTPKEEGPAEEVHVSRKLLESEVQEQVNPFFEHRGGEKASGDVCPYCFKKTMRLVTQYAVEKTKEMCEEGPKCPYLAGWCKWAAIPAHHRVAKGMIIGKVEPWKYAMGRCSDWGPHEGGPHEGHPPPEQSDKGFGKGAPFSGFFQQLVGPLLGIVTEQEQPIMVVTEQEPMQGFSESVSIVRGEDGKLHKRTERQTFSGEGKGSESQVEVKEETVVAEENLERQNVAEKSVVEKEKLVADEVKANVEPMV